MSEVAKQAREAAPRLLEQETDQLYVELGLVAKSLAEAPTRAGYADLAVRLTAVPAFGDRGAGDMMADFGRGLFKRIELAAYELVCASDDVSVEEREELLEAFGGGTAAVVGALATILVSYLGLSVAVAALVAAILVKLFVKPAYEEFCKAWTESMAPRLKA